MWGSNGAHSAGRTVILSHTRRDLRRVGERAANSNAARKVYNRMMPTILREGPNRFCFVSADGDEPHHVHLRRDDGFANFWLIPVELQSSGNYGRQALHQILRIVAQNQAQFLEDWNG